MQKIAISTPSHNFVGLYLRTKACINSGKYLLNSNISSTCSHNMVNFGPLMADIGLAVWGTAANFNGFCVLASLLRQRRSTEVNQTLIDVWPSPGLVHYIYILGGSCPLTEFCQVQNSLCIEVLRSPIFSALLCLMCLNWALVVRQTLWRGTKNGMRELSQTAPPIQQGGHHVGHRPTFLVSERELTCERELTFTFAICCRPSVFCLSVCL